MRRSIGAGLLVGATFVAAPALQSGKGLPQLQAELQAQLRDQTQISPTNDLPNPYERVYPWGELPTGNPGWKKGIRVGSARDGSVQFLIADLEPTASEHSGAEGVGVDSD